MKRETLREYARVGRKFGHRASLDRERALIESHLEALDEIDRLRAGESGQDDGFLVLPPSGEEQ